MYKLNANGKPNIHLLIGGDKMDIELKGKLFCRCIPPRLAMIKKSQSKPNFGKNYASC